MSILILSVSRGFALRSALLDFNIPAIGMRVDIWSYCNLGKTKEETVECGLRDIGNNTYTIGIIYLCTGVSNLTVKHGSHNISPKYNSWSNQQALLLSGRCAGLYPYIHTKVDKLSLLLSMCPDGNSE